MLRDANTISFALPGPMRRASLCVPPKPGVIPRPTSGCPNNALSEQIRISQLMASSLPFTAAITGTGKVSILRKISLPNLPKCSPCSLVITLIAAMSAPATKDFSPAPVRIIARISERSTASNAASISFSTSSFNAFSAFGRLIVMTATCPSTS